MRALTADAVAIAAAEVTVVFSSLSLLTGMLWGRAVWGIWWTWDARLTSMLLLWLLYVSYLMLRKLSSTGQTQTLAAVLSVFAAIDVPIVFMSIRWWRTQHPAPVFGGGPDSGIDPSMMPAFGWNVLGWAMWGVFLLVFRYALERRRQETEQEAALKSIEGSWRSHNETELDLRQQHGGAPPVGRIRCGVADSGWIRRVDCVAVGARRQRPAAGPLAQLRRRRRPLRQKNSNEAG
jgi:hypothetical protein